MLTSELVAYTPIVGFGAGFVLALFLTPLMKRVAMRVGAVDPRSWRKVHARDVPRLGGVAIAAGFFVPVLLIAFRVNLFSGALWDHPRKIVGLLIGALATLALGVYDDLRGASALKKLLVQIPVGGLTWWAGIRIGEANVPKGAVLLSPMMSMIITVTWIVIVTNAVNLIDGLDGLASGIAFQSLVATAVCAWHKDDAALVLISLCLAGGVGGFLVHNFHPASIFMGDSGSLFLGYVLAAASVWSSQKSVTAVGFVLPAVVLAIPLIDTSLAVWRRAVTGRSVFGADLQHVHHRLLILGLSQLQSVLLLYGVAFVFNGLSVALVYINDRRLAFSVMGVAVALAIAFARFLGYMRPSQVGVTAGLRRKNQLLRRVLKTLEHRLLTSESEADTRDALAEFHDAIRVVQREGEAKKAERRTFAEERRR